MKRTLQHQKGVIALLLALSLGSGTAYAYDFYKNCSTGQRLYYNVIDATNHYVEITYPGTSSNPYGGYTKPSGNIVLPSSVTHAGITYTVTKIGYKAFGWCDELTGSLSIPNSVITIGESAFDNCYGFSGTLTLGNSVTTIGDNAFRGCGGLGPNANSFTGSLIIPNSVITIGNSAFEGSYAGNNGTDLIIGDNVTTIGNYAFSGCYFTGTLTIGTGVTSIGAGAFMYCSGFTQVNYNATNCADADENDWIFYQVDACERPLTIGSNVERVPSYLFDDGGFVQVNFNATNCTSSGWPNPFRDCGGPLVIGNNVTVIDSHMFSGCSNFTSLTLGNSVTTIGDYAFYDCGEINYVTYPPGTPPERSGLTGNLTIPNSVTTIGSNAFGHCYNYYGCTLTIGTGVTTIGSDAFSWCEFSQVKFNATNCADFTEDSKPFTYSTGTLTIGSNVQNVPAYLTKGASFTQVYFNAINCADAIQGDKPFEDCSGTLSIGSSVTRIPAFMFYDCDGFTNSLSIPSSVTSIGERAFYDCDNLSGLTLGSSLNSIGTYAFCSCNGLSGSLTIPNSVTMLGTWAFRYCNGFTGSLTIGNSLSEISLGAFYGCNGFMGLTIGSNVNYISGYSLYGLSNITSMTVLAETPPFVESYVFDNVPKSIPVYVPCSSVEDYQTASGWSEFTNYQCNSTVTVTAMPTAGGLVTGGGTYSSGSSVTVTATPNSNYLFMHWAEDGIVVSSNPSYTFTVSEDTELEAVFMSQSYAGTIIGEGTYENNYLPSFSYYKYSLTEQIYTAAELGGSFTINSISFFNAGDTETRLYDVYLVHTSKSFFSSNTDWIPVYQADCVFTGEVIMREGMWTTIVFDTPFTYNGTSNLALVVDDNTGGYTFAPHMACRVYDASQSNQAIRIYSDDTNYQAHAPSSYTGTRLSVKNQIMLNRPGSLCDITITPAKSSAGSVSGGGQYFKGDVCTLKATANSGYTFVDWAYASGVVVSTDANYSFTVMTSRTLTAHFMSGSDFCSLTFDLFDSYGDGWNDNQLVVDFENGMSTKLAVPIGVSKATYTLPVEANTEVELSWIEGSYVDECSFAVSDPEGVKYVGSELNENFEYSFVADCGGNSALVYLGDHSKANNYFLPSYSFYNYSLSEQIYTASEIGEAGLINSIAFYNVGAETKTRTYQIYLATTNKAAFSSSTDWISTSNATLVYSGSVTMYAGRWTPILFSTPFDYDGVSNLVLIVDDNTGTYTSSPHMSCLVYPADGLQALRIFSDGTDYYPASPSSYTGTLQDVKNQIMLNIASCEEPLDLTVTDITLASANIDWTSDHYSFELQYRKADPSNDFEHGLGLWTTIDADGDGYNWYYTNTTNLPGHDGSAGLVESESWYNGTVLTPDNYLVSPQIILGGSISFWASAQDNEWVAEHFGVAVSTTGNTNPANFTTIQEWTMTAKSEGAKTGITRSDNRTQGTWYQYTVDLSAYADQTGYVAIRHFNSTDMFRLNVDDITVVQPGVNSSWTTDYHASSPYALTGLTPAIQYEVRVRSTCVGDYYSDWVYTTFTTAICPPEDQCELTFTLTDSYGDGWNGAAIRVFDAATNILLASMSAPSHGLSNTPTTDTYTLAVCDGRELRFEWVNGSYDSECSYIVTDINGNVVFSGGGAMSESVSYMVDCASVTIQTIALSSGPNWFSTYIDITLDDLKSALVSEVPSNSTITIKSATQNTVYSRGRWNGALDWDVANMYIIIVPTDCQISLEGMLLNPAEHPITIVGDGNPTWIGFPFSNSMTVTAAFEGFAVNGDIIKSSNGNAQYSRGRWNGSVTDLDPGQGYIYVSAPGSADRVLSFAQFDYVDLGLPSGLLWATCNVGANAPEEYGDYFAWGETTPKDTYNWSTYQYCNGSNNTLTKYCDDANYGYNGFTDDLTTLLPEDDAATANWGQDWRMPTMEEWLELYNNTTATWTTQNGVSGRLFTAANGNSLFLPAAGYRSYSNLSSAGSWGYYWSSSLHMGYPVVAWQFYLSSGSYYVSDLNRDSGFTVRPVCSSRQN